MKMTASRPMILEVTSIGSNFQDRAAFSNYIVFELQKIWAKRDVAEFMVRGKFNGLAVKQVALLANRTTVKSVYV